MYDLNFEIAKNNEPTIKVNGYYLHSKYNPSLEAQKLVDNIYQPHHLHIIYGYGLGYIVKELVNKRQFNEPILIIDPLIEQGFITLNNKKENVHYISGEKLEAVRQEIALFAGMTNKMFFYVSPNYKKIFLKEIHQMAQLVNDAQQKELINISTTNYFAMDWQINYAMNLEKISNDLSLNSLFKQYTCPVVIASSGPSLNKQLPLLKKYRDFIILICAGSTINSLLNAGIKPDYVVSIDGGINNFKHFKNLNLFDMELIYSPLLHYQVRENFSANCYVFIPYVRPSLKEILNNKVHKDFPVLIGGGSVAHYALSVAKIITSGPICMIGQDLAYTNNQTHSNGNKNNKSIENKEVIWVDGCNGEKVKSNLVFKGMINIFEEMNSFDLHESNVFNCTEGGAKINGYKQMPFEDFLNRYTKDCVTRIILKNPIQEKQNDVLKEDFLIYDEILSLLKKGVKVIEKEHGKVFSENGLNQIKKIEKKLNTLYYRTCVDMLLEPIITSAEHEFLPPVNENKYDEFIRVKKYITVLYEQSISMMERYIERLNKTLAEESEKE